MPLRSSPARPNLAGQPAARPIVPPRPDLVARLRKFTEPARIPIAVGFGISNAEHVKAVGQFADAAIIGSALVALIETTPPEQAAAAVGNFIAGLRA